MATMAEHTTSRGERRRPVYVPAVGPRLKWLLLLVLGLVTLLGANAAYLAGITFLEWLTDQPYQNQFYHWMFLGHLVLGLLLIVPFVVFALIHLRHARKRPNRRAVRVGYALFVVSLVLLASGVALLRVGGFDLKQPAMRATAYWLHVTAPLAAMWLYWLHRLAGPPIRWRTGVGALAVVALLVGATIVMHGQDPRRWHEQGSPEGERYFHPSLARTTTGKFIPARALMMDRYCLDCHPDVHAGWSESAHRFSSFNNPAYLATVRETREVLLKRDGDVRASRWCAGCHDPVPFLSGAFDDPHFDDVRHPTAHAGITCTVCHAMTHINSVRGNGDYTIEEPLHYPFAYSDNPVLKWINHQLVKAKPAFHRKTFLKPLHRTTEFCSVCHKVHLPYELTHYKEFLRGQNHYDSFLLSGVSGHGARSFYYPKRAEANCNGCHMPLKPSNDFGAKFFDGAETLSIHDHLFPGANTALPWLRGNEEVVERQREFLEGSLRVDLFALREEGRIDGALIAPLRPQVPTLQPGRTYLLEAVLRTLRLGHHFTQGTADSNEVWLEVTVRSGDRIIGKSGGRHPETGEVDPWSHFVNVFMLDREGRRIDRRNAQDIFVPLYDHQIPPGAARVAHYALRLPDDLSDPVTVEARLQFRKFDTRYMQYVASSARPGDSPLRGHRPGEPYRNLLSIVTIASDRITFPIAGVDQPVENPTPDVPAVERFNDYGIGLLLEGKAQLRQAEEAFREVERLGGSQGSLNRARVLYREGRLDEAVEAIRRAAQADNPPPAWTMAWLSGLINREQGHLEAAAENFRDALDYRTQETLERGFDFRDDYVLRNLLGATLFDLARRERGAENESHRRTLLQAAVGEFQKTLERDPENVTAHYNLQLLYRELGDHEAEQRHRRLHERYRPDDNARDRAVRLARERYPAARHASEAIVIYPLTRPGAFELPPEAWLEQATADVSDPPRSNVGAVAATAVEDRDDSTLRTGESKPEKQSPPGSGR